MCCWHFVWRPVVRTIAFGEHLNDVSTRVVLYLCARRAFDTVVARLASCCFQFAFCMNRFESLPDSVPNLLCRQKRLRLIASSVVAQGHWQADCWKAGVDMAPTAKRAPRAISQSSSCWSILGCSDADSSCSIWQQQRASKSKIVDGGACGRKFHFDGVTVSMPQRACNSRLWSSCGLHWGSGRSSHWSAESLFGQDPKVQICW